MPYQNVPDDLQDKMESCVLKVMEGGEDKDTAIAICYASVVGEKSVSISSPLDLDALKVGARNSAADAARIQAVHDAAVELGAMCESHDDEPGEYEAYMMSGDALVSFGAEVKALGDGRVGGYLVRFSTPADPDVTGDYFDASTDFGPIKSSAVYYNHGMDNAIKRRVIGDGTLSVDDVGVWVEAQLKMADEYERSIYQMAQAGKLGWSSGTAPHLVERKPAGKAQHVTRWPLGLDASLTPTPAEPRNRVQALKSVYPDPAPSEPVQIKSIQGDKIMENVTISEDKLAEMLQTAAKTGAESVLASLPATKAGVNVSVVTDEADKPFTTLAEHAAAVKSFYTTQGRAMDARLKSLSVKAITGAGEAVPSTGGFLVNPTLTNEILKPMHEAGPFTSDVRRLPVSSDSNYGWINGVNETSRVNGSRWGGLVGYRLGEGVSYTGSKPAFKRINWELNKYGVLVYATDELLADATQFSAIVQQGASEELAFMANYDILWGGGAGEPLGVVSSTARVSVAKETNQAAATINSENLTKMWSRMDSRSKARAKWYYNSDCLPQLLKIAIAIGTGGVLSPYVQFANGQFTIMGRPAVETEFCQTLGTQGDIVLGDFSQYLWWDKAMTSGSNIYLEWLTDQTVFKYTYRCDGKPSLTTPVTPLHGTATTSPFVVLDTRS